MSCCEPTAPQVETFEEQVTRVTRSMSPEKSGVVRLCMESQARDKWCASIDKSQRHLARECKALKRLMRERKRHQNIVPRASTKKELAEQKEDENKLAACRKEYVDLAHEWTVQNAYAVDAMERWAHAKIARLERLLRDASVEC